MPDLNAESESEHSKRPAPRPPKTPSAQRLPRQLADVRPEFWMNDLRPHIHARKLTDIVIPSSHDSGTYGLDGLAWTYGGSQNQSFDLTAALNHGVRHFDVRVEYYDPGNGSPANFYAVHGFLHSTRVTLSDMLTQIQTWTLAPGHEYEIILLALRIDPKGQPFPTMTCRSFTDALGDAWLSPNRLQEILGFDDPGQATLDQMASLGGTTPARVIFDNAGCAGGQGWPVDLFHGYYANQCYAEPYIGFPGIDQMVLEAARTRASDAYGGNIYPGDPNQLGDPLVDGFYSLGLPATTTASCLFPLRWFDLQATKDVQAAVYQQWQADPETRAHLNLISGDFIEETSLVAYVIAMNSTWPVIADRVTPLGPHRYFGVVERDFAQISGYATYDGKPVDGQRVDFVVEPENGPFFTDNGQASTYANSKNGAATVRSLNAGKTLGTFTLTAYLPNGLDSAFWKLEVKSATDVTKFEAAAGAHQSGEVDTELYTNFAVRALNAVGETIPNIPVNFDASPSGGKFSGSPDRPATATTDEHGVATAPAYTAGTRAGPTSIAVSSVVDTSTTFSIPFTITPGPPAYFVPLYGDLQSTAIELDFPVALTAKYTDFYGNGIPNHTDNWNFDPYLAWWPDPYSGEVTSDADGIATAPVLLTAGDFVRDASNPLLVRSSNTPGMFRLRITPGPAASVTATAGDGQSTGTGQRFATPLQAKVSDGQGNPIVGTPVSFEVTDGDAAFPRLDVGLLSQLTGLGDTSTVPASPRAGVIAPTDEQGVATAPTLTAGPKAGDITVQASSATAPTATLGNFLLTSRAIPPSPPTITSLTNGDGQVAVAFTPGDQGTAPVSAYTLSATNASQPGAAPVVATGPGSPITVTGLINGNPYTFTVTATSADGTSPPSQASGPVNVGVPPTITSQPAGGTVGVRYSSAFIATGAPTPTFTLLSGGLPPGLNLHSDGTITGTPTAAGDYTITVQADNHVGLVDSTATISIATPGLHTA